MATLPALLAGALLLAASGGKPVPHELLNATPVYNAAAGPGPAPPPKKPVKINSSDITFAVELARIHEPHPGVLRQFATLLRANRLNAQAQELLGAPPSSGPPKAIAKAAKKVALASTSPMVVPGANVAGRVGDGAATDVFGDLMGQLFPPTTPEPGDDAAPGAPPPGWTLTSDGWYADPISYTAYNEDDAWSLYWSRLASAQNAQSGPSVSGNVGRRAGSLSRNRHTVGDIGDIGGAISNATSAAQGAVANAASNVASAAQGAASSVQNAAQGALAQGQGALASAQQQASQGAAAAQNFIQQPSLSSAQSLAGALPKNLPGVGQIQGQIKTGMSLLAQIQGGSITSAAEGGFELAAGAAADVLANLGPKGQAVAAILEGAVAGVATGIGAGVAIGAAAGASIGPWGAVAGAIVGAAVGFAEGEFMGAPLPPLAVANSTATSAIAGALQGWITAWGQDPDGAPPGQHMADWCAAATPPKSMDSLESKQFLILGKSIVQWASQHDSQGLFYDHRTKLLGIGNTSPTILAYWKMSFNPTPGASSVSLQEFVSWQIPICAPVFWNWFAPTQMAGTTCSSSTGGGDNDEGYVTALSYPGTQQSMPSPNNPKELETIWRQYTRARGGKTANEIVDSAKKRRPSPKWFALDVYGAWLPTGGKLMGNTWSTVYFDCDLLNGMATVLGMLAVGSSTQAIVSELLLQVSILYNSGIKKYSAESVSPGLKMLLDDYLYMAHQEHWEAYVKPRQLSGWVAHYIALATRQERNTMEEWIGFPAPIATLRTKLEALNS